MTDGPVDEHKFEVLARISVLEILVAHLYKQQYLDHGRTLEQVKSDHSKMQELLSKQTNPGFSAAESDLITSEMEDALRDVLQTAQDLFIRYAGI